MITIEKLKKEQQSNLFRGFFGLDGPTPLFLVEEMVESIPVKWEDPTLKFLFPAAGHGNFPIVVFWKLFHFLEKTIPNEQERSIHILTNMLYLNEIKVSFCGWFRNFGFRNIHQGDFLKYPNTMKFDVVLGNDPYEVKVGDSNTEPIWDKFLLKSFDLVKENGYVSKIHPSGWRSPKGRFLKIQKLLLSKKIIYLKLNDFKAGQKVFGVGTNFDYYCVQNTEEFFEKTKVTSIDGITQELDLNKMVFIPNGKFEIIDKLVAKNGEERVTLLHSESAYAHRKKWISTEPNDEFCHPCIYSITQKDGLNLHFSNTDNKGHFGIPKVIWSNGLGTYPVLDETGQYGLMEYSCAIVDDLENLKKIKTVLESPKFLNLMEYVRFTNNKYDNKVIGTFKKDFWKNFIDE